MARILAIDSGLTVTRAVVFDLQGRQCGVSRCGVEQLIPAPRRVERDMNGLWHQTASAVRDALADSGTAPGDVIAIAATAHGDGVCLLDRVGAPLGHGILSLDSRAGAQVVRWQADGTAAQPVADRAGTPCPCALGAAGMAAGQRTGPFRPDRPHSGVQGLAAVLPDRHHWHGPDR